MCRNNNQRHSAADTHPVFLEISKLSPLMRFLLLERHLISSELLTKIDNGGIIFKRGEELSLMINEEDHIRLQVLKSGLDLDGAWEIADKADDELSTLLQFAFDENFGYLTACPTNLGTGLRCSVLLHLPALVITQRIKQVIETLINQNYFVRGFYGEGSAIKGGFFQLSNKITLGVREEAIISSMYEIIMWLIELEEDRLKIIKEFGEYKAQLAYKVGQLESDLKKLKSVDDEKKKIEEENKKLQKQFDILEIEYEIRDKDAKQLLEMKKYYENRKWWQFWKSNYKFDE